MFAKRESQRKQRRYGAHHLIAGTSAGVVTTAALYPLDLVKTRYQASAAASETLVQGLARANMSHCNKLYRVLCIDTAIYKNLITGRTFGEVRS